MFLPGQHDDITQLPYAVYQWTILLSHGRIDGETQGKLSSLFGLSLQNAQFIVTDPRRFLLQTLWARTLAVCISTCSNDIWSLHGHLSQKVKGRRPIDTRFQNVIVMLFTRFDNAARLGSRGAREIFESLKNHAETMTALDTCYCASDGTSF
jgi:hypothetical protein